jgi:hypothetical protein
VSAFGEQNKRLGTEKSLIFSFTHQSFKIFMCMYFCIFFYMQSFGNSYSLQSREMGPILDWRKAASLTSLDFLSLVFNSSQPLFVWFCFVFLGCQSFGEILRAEIQRLFSYRLEEDKWMNVQVGDIIKLKNDQPVTVSDFSSCGFLYFCLEWESGSPTALLPPLYLVTLICLTLCWRSKTA